MKSLQKIAYDVGYVEGLIRSEQLKDVRSASLDKTLADLLKQHESAKREYLTKFGTSHCPVVKQLSKALDLDFQKHRDLGTKACSLILVNGRFL